MTNKIAVIYLARLAEGFAAFEAFAEAYRKYPSGELHDLIIVLKGFNKPEEFAVITQIFEGIKYKTISVTDDIGFDIHAYHETALRITNPYICCFNTFTVIQTDNWLAKLWSNMCKPGVGMVGATGSFESLYSSNKLITFASYAATFPAKFDDKLVRGFEWIIKPTKRVTVYASRYKLIRICKIIYDLIKKRPSLFELQDKFLSTWATLISHDGALSYFQRDFPYFPNPHIRTTAFMVGRTDFIDTTPPENNKIACCRFESGRDGLSLSLINKGKEILVVGADGFSYKMDQWPSCGAFRSGDQSNLLAIDNHTSRFEISSQEERLTHSIMTWGGYHPDFPSKTELYGTSFARNFTIEDRCAQFRKPLKPKCERFFSIAIPTHNRLDLVLTAITTIKRQNYSNWEIVVFDNCSEEPVAAAIAALEDPRIRSERSEEFLSVTESWNNAIDMANGDFVTLIGDDDGLAPDYFDRMNFLIEKFSDADLIFTNLYQFMYPGVLPGRPEGYVVDLPMADFLFEVDYPFEISGEIIRRSVDNSLRMRRSFHFNMPAFCCSNELINKMRIDGKVFHSPFPDYYFANVALALASKPVAEPRRMAFQGVSKASFAFNMLNSKLDEGYKKLGYDVDKDIVYSMVAKYLLPVRRYNSEYIVTMAHVANVLDDKSRQPDFDHYRKVQIWQNLSEQTSIFKWMRTGNSAKMWAKLSRTEKCWAIKANIFRLLGERYPRYWSKSAAKMAKASSQYQFRPNAVYYYSGKYSLLSQLFDDIESGSF